MFGKKSKECNITSRPGKPGKNYGDVGNYFDEYFAEKERGIRSLGRKR